MESKFDDVLNFVAQGDLYEAITFCSQRYAEAFDSSPTLDEQHKRIDELVIFNEALNQRLEWEPNGQLIKKLWHELRAAMKFLRMNEHYIEFKGLDDDVLDYECSTGIGFELVEFADLLNGNAKQHLTR